jgi:sodium/bile acid cotransporter 7
LLFFLGAAALAGYLLPEWGEVLKRNNILDAGLVISFFLTGLTLDAHIVPQALKTFRVPAAAVLSSLVVYPVVAWLAARFVLPYEFVIGCCIIGAGPVSVSSGTILTALARGNVPLSILICILTHLISFFTIPLVLDFLVGAGGNIELPVVAMLGGLALKVLVPLVAGLLLRPHISVLVNRYTPYFSTFQSGLILLMIYTAVSSSAPSIRQLDTLLLKVTLVVMGIYHVMLLLNIIIARLLKFTEPDKIAFTIHASQKTLGVSFIVWSGYFAAEYPAGFIPAIICHLTQMVAAPFLVEFYNKRRDRS